jgi:hypothetical protein
MILLIEISIFYLIQVSEVSADDVSQRPVGQDRLHVDGVEVVRLLQSVQP